MKPSLVGRLMLVYAAVVAAVLVSTWWSQRSLAGAEEALHRLSDRSVEALDLSARLETLVHEKSRLADYLLSGDARIVDELRPHRDRFRDWIDEMDAFVRTDEERQLLGTMRTSYQAYTAGADEVARLGQEGRTDEARRQFARMADDIEHFLADGQRLFTLAKADMGERRSATEAAVAHGRALVLWLTAFGAVFALALGFVLSRLAARPIYDLVLRLGASGVVDTVEVHGNEIGALESQVNALLDRVREQERSLLQAEKLSELGEIASEIAHETLNPLSGVTAMLQALRRTPLPRERMQQELAEMERQLGRIATTVRRLMSYARPLEPHVRPASVRDVLERAVRVATLAPGGRGHAVHVFAPVNGLTWEMDPDLIEQVLVNLIVNGCEASPVDDAVEVRAAVEDGGLAIAVRDHGRGIPAASRERLFRPFFTTKPEGNGLGLAISRNIAQEHGGQLEVVPTASDGAEFRLLLPRGRPACVSPS
jgi:signal transduction histidine kinase